MEPNQSQEIPPEILAWAKATIDENLIAEELRDIQVNGGKQLHQFIHELEVIVSLGE